VTYAATANDNCPGTTVAYSPASGSTFAVGATTVTATATDARNNIATCTFTVNVNDVTPPSIVCPANVNVNNDAGLCSAVVIYATPVGTDNCPGATTTITAGLASGSAFNFGVTNITYTVTAGGGSSSCSFAVTVTDNEGPTMTCPAAITINTDPGQCSAVINYTVSANDNCPGVTTAMDLGLASGSAFPVGYTLVQYTATDAAGLTATCNFDVQVNDNQVPAITCPANVSVSNDNGVCGAAVSFTVSATDNCNFCE
jgi:hypothetical protein